MSYKLKVIKDYPIGFWMLDETSGTTALDSSGCDNNGTYTGGVTTGLLPLVQGGVSGTTISTTKSISFPITKDYTGQVSTGNIADKNSLDNDFSIEAWFYPKITTSNKTTIFGNSTNKVGIFFENGDIIFSFGNKDVRYTLPYISKSHHVVGVYNNSTLSIYHDGYLRKSISIIPSTLGIIHSGITLSSGPSANASDSFIVDAPAVYRYALSPKQILEHFIDSNIISGIQIANPDQGVYYYLSDENIRSEFRYSYPASKPWQNFVSDKIFYDTAEESISLKENTAGGSVTETFTDYITIPTNIGLTSSKVEWSGTSGITIETSLDGITYSTCTNGLAIPQYTLSSFSTTGKLYIRITLSSSDVSKQIPKLKYLYFNFYKSKDLYAENFGDKLTYEVDEYHLGSNRTSILSRDYRNGLRCNTGGGFKITTTYAVRTIEFFYTPSALTNSALVSSVLSGSYAASNYSWNNAGSISRTNVSAIYVNGVSVTSQTSISNVFAAGETYHVVIVYTASIGNVIKFNYDPSGSTASLYQNLALYQTAFDASKALEHYNLYINRTIVADNTSSFTLTENTPAAYNNDWTVIQSI